jgi:uncharacterized SAM-binding protein YcdF (DUF218 family)
MSFELTKILPLVVYPLGIGLVLFIVVTLTAVTGSRRFSFFAGILGIVVLWTASMPVTTNLILNSLESDYPFIDIDRQPIVDAIVVLGGFTGRPDTGRGDIEINDGIDRLLHGMRLFRAGKAPTIVLLGGAARGHTPESHLMARLLEEFGIPRDVMLLEDKSRNTRQNAVNASSIIKQRDIKSVLLVTSAFHMRRAQAVFEKLGVEVIPAATDYQVGEPDPSVLDWLPDAEALWGTTFGIKEYIGWVVYSIRGWV